MSGLKDKARNSVVNANLSKNSRLDDYWRMTRWVGQATDIGCKKPEQQSVCKGMASSASAVETLKEI